MNKVTKAVIPVAGFGTRFLPYTKSVPKMMLPIIDKPVLQFIVEEAVNSGITDILFVVGQHSEIIEGYFRNAPDLLNRLEADKYEEIRNELNKIVNQANYTFVVQNEQKGTAHAVALAESFANGEPFLLMFGDDLMRSEALPVSAQLISAYEQTGKTVLGCKKVSLDSITMYASAEYDAVDGRLYNLTKITEKPEISLVKSTLAPLGRYVCSNDIFDYIRKIGPGKNNEYQVTDAFNLQALDGKAVAYEFEGVRYDTGDKLGYLTAFVDFAMKDPELGRDFTNFIISKSDKRD
jgi:UTP--glucose-1-phosphate uridylyltransferase